MFLSGRILQCIRKGYRSSEHLLWEVDGVWWVLVFSYIYIYMWGFCKLATVTGIIGPKITLQPFLPLRLMIYDANFRVWEIEEDDLVGLHFQHWWRLWTLPWNKLCVCRWNLLLVLCETSQTNLNWMKFSFDQIETKIKLRYLQTLWEVANRSM